MTELLQQDSVLGQDLVLTVAEVPDVHTFQAPTDGQVHDAEALLLAILELPIEARSIWVQHCSVAVLQILMPLTLVPGMYDESMYTVPSMLESIVSSCLTLS